MSARRSPYTHDTPADAYARRGLTPPAAPARPSGAFGDTPVVSALALGQLHAVGGPVPAARIAPGALADLRALAARGWAEECPDGWRITNAGRAAWLGGARPAGRIVA